VASVKIVVDDAVSWKIGYLLFIALLPP